MKNLLSENMLRFGTKNLSESQKQKLSEQSADPAELKASGMDGGTMKQIGAVDKQLGTSQKNLGIAMKIAGQIMGATRGAFNHDPNKIASALKLIKQYGGKPIYDSLLWYVSKSADFKQKLGENYPLVMTWISEYFDKQTTDYEDIGTDTKWLEAYQSILSVYNSKEQYSIKSQTDWTFGGK
jgi:hypothetical protein